MFNIIFCKLQSSLFTSAILKSSWEGCYSVTSLNCISTSLDLPRSSIWYQKSKMPRGQILTVFPKYFPSSRNLPNYLSKINLFSVLSSNTSYFDIHYFIDMSFFEFRQNIGIERNTLSCVRKGQGRGEGGGVGINGRWGWEKFKKSNRREGVENDPKCNKRGSGGLKPITMI